jgi:hypothetical protein
MIQIDIDRRQRQLNTARRLSMEQIEHIDDSVVLGASNSHHEEDAYHQHRPPPLPSIPLMATAEVMNRSRPPRPRDDLFDNFEEEEDDERLAEEESELLDELGNGMGSLSKNTTNGGRTNHSDSRRGDEASLSPIMAEVGQVVAVQARPRPRPSMFASF